MEGTLNLNDLKDEPILYYENALSYVCSKENEESKKEIPTCVIYPNKNIKIGFPIYSLSNINKNENLVNDNNSSNNRINEEPLITYASESKHLYPVRVKVYHGILYVFIFLQVFLMLLFKDNANAITTGDISLMKKYIFIFISISHILAVIPKLTKFKTFTFDIYTSLSLFFLLLSILIINCFINALISILQFFIFYLHYKINYYYMPHSCVIHP